MGIICKLIQGADELDLNSGRYCTDDTFTPPVTRKSITLARGGKKVDEEAEPREFTFTVQITGVTSTSEAERGLSNIQSFLNRAGDENNPVYLCYRSYNDYTYEPNWGGGVGLYNRYEIIEGHAEGGPLYRALQSGTSIVNVPIILTIKPFMYWKLMGTAIVEGGIFEDYIGTGTGWARGIRLPEATTNEFANPIFENPTSPTTGWTIGSSLRVQDIRTTLSENSSDVLFGIFALRMTANAATNNTFTQTITLSATSWTLSFYVRRADRAAVSTTDVDIYYNSSAQSASFKSLGDGWYLMYKTVTGTGGASATGIVVKSAYSIYLAGCQAENKAYYTPLCHGDLLGNSWDGTAHGATLGTDTSTRDTTELLGGRLHPTEGTIRICWQADFGSSFSADLNLFEEAGGVGWNAHYDIVFGRYEFSDGTNTINADASLSAGDKVVLHFVYGPGGLVVYKNGASIGSGSTYTPPITIGVFNNLGIGYATLYLGTNQSLVNYSQGVFHDFTTFDRAMTAAEALADYNQCVQQLNDDEFVSRIPYFWTDDGLSALDNADDGTSQNWGIIGQVPGDAPADIFFTGAPSNVANSDDYYLAFLDLPLKGFKDLEFLSYVPGTPPDTPNITTSDVTIGTVTWTEHESMLMEGREVCVMIRADEDGADDVTLRAGVDPGGGTYYWSDYEPSDWIASSTTKSIDATPFIDILKSPTFFDDYVTGNYDFTVSIRAQGTRPTGSGTLNLYYMQVLPRPFYRIINISSSGNVGGYIYSRGQIFEGDTSGAVLEFGYESKGDEPRLLPNRLNAVLSFSGKEGNQSDSTDKTTMTFYIIPRSRLL